MKDSWHHLLPQTTTRISMCSPGSGIYCQIARSPAGSLAGKSRKSWNLHTALLQLHTYSAPDAQMVRSPEVVLRNKATALNSSLFVTLVMVRM